MTLGFQSECFEKMIHSSHDEEDVAFSVLTEVECEKSMNKNKFSMLSLLLVI